MAPVVPGDTYDTACEITDPASLSEESVEKLVCGHPAVTPDVALTGGQTFNPTVLSEAHKDANFATYVCPQIGDLQRAALEQLLLMGWAVTALKSQPSGITLRQAPGTEEREGKQANELIIHVISGLRDVNSNG